MPLDLAAMRGVHVDSERQLAVVQGGALWADVDRETQAHGLVAPGGGVGHGRGRPWAAGFGWVRRKHGLSVDALVEAHVVCADGRVRTASADPNPDLFWAQRGGGRNFGVVTSFTSITVFSNVSGRATRTPSRPSSSVTTLRCVGSREPSCARARRRMRSSQETWLAVVRGLSAFEGRSSLRTWNVPHPRQPREHALSATPAASRSRRSRPTTIPPWSRRRSPRTTSTARCPRANASASRRTWPSATGCAGDLEDMRRLVGLLHEASEPPADPATREAVSRAFRDLRPDDDR
jgi:hypothetical protein